MIGFALFVARTPVICPARIHPGRDGTDLAARHCSIKMLDVNVQNAPIFEPVRPGARPEHARVTNVRLQRRRLVVVARDEHHAMAPRDAMQQRL